MSLRALRGSVLISAIIIFRLVVIFGLVKDHLEGIFGAATFFFALVNGPASEEA